MGLITPTPPPVDVEEWKRQPHLERIKPLAQDWAINGFGTPGVIYVLYRSWEFPVEVVYRREVDDYAAART